MLSRRRKQADRQRTDDKLNAIAYGFFIPIFFMESGAKIDLASVGAAPTRLVVCALLLVAVRALPVFVAQSLGAELCSTSGPSPHRGAAVPSAF